MRCPGEVIHFWKGYRGTAKCTGGGGGQIVITQKKNLENDGSIGYEFHGIRGSTKGKDPWTEGGGEKSEVGSRERGNIKICIIRRKKFCLAD